MRKSALFFIIAALSFTPTAFADQVLAMKSGCLGCHKTDTKLVGPAFKDVAAKYSGDTSAIDRLVNKVKSGSKPGEPLVWGAAMMPPSPASEENIRVVIEWVMTLK